MKLTTFGMWETFRKTLLETLSDSLPQSHPEITKEKINTILLEDVVTKMLEVAQQYYQEQGQEASQLEAYKASLNTVKDTLSNKLAIPSDNEALSAAVDTFVNDCLVFFDKNKVFLEKLKAISVRIKNDAIAELYGNDFEGNYPELYKKIGYNDENIINATVKAATQEITHSHLFQQHVDQEAANENLSIDSDQIKTAMIEHIKYMHEIAEQSMQDGKFPQEFKNTTGMTMKAWKEKQIEKAGEDCKSNSPLCGSMGSTFFGFGVSSSNTSNQNQEASQVQGYLSNCPGSGK